MKAKDIITKQLRVESEEAEGQSLRGEGPPPGATMGPRRLRRPMPDIEGDFPPEIMRRMRRSGEPEQGPFSVADTSKLKDILLLIVTKMANNEFDAAIARHMMSGRPLEPGQIQHILDEAGQIQDIPPSHQQVLQKAYEFMQSQRGG